MGGYTTVADALRQFYGAEYLYSVLPLDVVGDTLGVLYGRRRSLKSLRNLYHEPDSVWRQMFRGTVELAVASGVRELMYDRIAVSRTRRKEPITLAPLSLDCIGEGQGDKSVANAYRAIGGLASRFFTPAAARKLMEHVERWSQQPLARLAEAVLRHAETYAGGRGARAAEPSRPSQETVIDDARFLVAREDVEHLVHAWDDAPFGAEQQLDQLRTILCFHLTLYIFRTAVQPQLHRQEISETRLAFVCDAAQVVGSPMARVAAQSLAFWMGRLREANLEICYRSATSLRASDSQAWDRIFHEIDMSPPDTRDDFIAKRSESVAGWVFPEDRRKRSRHNAELAGLLSEGIRKLYARADHQRDTEQQQRTLADAMVEVFATRSRMLHRVFESVRSFGDGAGLIGPKGTHRKKRFLLRADLLETLSVVHCARAAAGKIVSDDPLSAGHMLRTWFDRYGIVIDAARPEVVDAVDRGQFDPRLVPYLPDAALSADNVRELEDRLVELRLARRFSDASVSLDERALLPASRSAS